MSSTLYLGKYRNETARKPFWDYRNEGAYFITICTKNREHYFGEITSGKLILSPLGAVAYVLWNEIVNHTNNCALGEFVVMPNHVHGILILNNQEINGKIHCRDLACKVPTMNHHPTMDHHCTMNCRPTMNFSTNKHATNNFPEIAHPTTAESSKSNCSSGPINHEHPDLEFLLQLESKNEQMAQISPKSGSISTIVRSYKSAVTKYANRLGYPFGWQSRFHDHIIKDDVAFHRISAYIKNNPINWEKDKGGRK